MSSHHFVREGQEPALFITEDFQFNDSVASLLEWAPLVMVVDTALDVVLSWGTKIDVIVVAAEQLEITAEKVSAQMPLTLLTYQKDQDPVLVGLAELCKNQNAVHINIKVSDEILLKMENFIDAINIVLLDVDTRWIPISNKKFSKWLPAKAQLVIRFDESDQLVFNSLIQLQPDVFETTAEGNVTIASNKLFWIGEKLS